MTEKKYRIRVLNNISAGGLKRLPWDRFAVSADIDDPHAILVRSADLHDMQISESLLAVGRAGSGTNNIPIPEHVGARYPGFQRARSQCQCREGTRRGRHAAGGAEH